MPVVVAVHVGDTDNVGMFERANNAEVLQKLLGSGCVSNVFRADGLQCDFLIQCQMLG
jgi:hypothetical protein